MVNEKNFGLWMELYFPKCPQVNVQILGRQLGKLNRKKLLKQSIMRTNTNSQLHALLGQSGLMEQKESLIYSFTTGRTNTSREMTEGEAIDLIKHLKTLVKKVEPVKKNLPNEALNKTRRYIISLWYRIENAQTDEEKERAMQMCFNWVQKHFKGNLNSFQSADLFKIKLAAQKVLKDRAKAVRSSIMNY